MGLLAVSLAASPCYASTQQKITDTQNAQQENQQQDHVKHMSPCLFLQQCLILSRLKAGSKVLPEKTGLVFLIHAFLLLNGIQ